MIELPRACFVAEPDRRARRLLLVRHQRPDADRARVLARRRRGASSCPPTSSARSSTARRSRRSTSPASASSCGWPRGSGREAKPELKLGICGEHGGDPDSIDFFHMAGLDYVSCSPFRVPIARVAAAQAAIATIRDDSRVGAAATPGCENGMVRPARRRTVAARLRRARAAAEALCCRRSPRRSYPARRARAGGRLPAAHAVPARPRPDRPLQGVPAAEAQDAGVRGARGRPLPHPADPHARGDAGLAHGRPGAAPQRGPHRGDRARARPRPPAVRAHRRGGARRLPARALRPRFRHNEHSLRVVDVLERASTSPSPVRDGILRHSSGAGEPATLEGRIVRLVDRIAYINHDIDDALRAGVLAPGDLPRRGHRRARADRARSGSTRWSTTSSSTPSGRATSCRATQVGGGDAAPARRSCSSDVYLGPTARAEHAKIERVLRGLFDHYCEHPEELPTSTAARSRRPGDRLPRGHDRPLRHPRLERSGSCRGASRARPWRATPTSPASGSATRSTSWSSSARAPSCAAPARGGSRACARSTTSARRRSGSTPWRSSTTASAAAWAATSSSSSWRRRGSTSRGRSSRSPTASGSSSSARTRTRGPPSAASAATRLLGLLERTAAYYVRVLWESAEAEDARAYLTGRGLDEATLREFRSATRRARGTACCSPRGGRATPRPSCSRAGLASRGREAAASTTASAARIMFPLADEQGRVLRLRRPGGARRASSPST